MILPVFRVGSLLAVCMAALLFSGSTMAQVSPQRLDKLRRGINTSHWFSQARAYDGKHQKTYITEKDVALIESMGFSYVRLSLEPDFLKTGDDPAQLHPEHLAIYRDAIRMILDHGMAVTVDIHPMRDEFVRWLKGPDGSRDFARFWGALAAHLSDTDPEHVFFEILNEPQVNDLEQWRAIQHEALRAIRKAAPQHTIIAAPDRWSAIQELLRFEPYDEPNVVYNFHCYDPHNFTHQGATWGSEAWKHLKHLPYPSSPEAVRPLLAEIEDEDARRVVVQYGEQRWDRRTIDEHVRQAVEWGKKHGVPLICNEFGVYRKVSKPEHRAAFLRDLTDVLESHGIGWAMWDYAGGFSVVNPEDGQRTPDKQTLKAIGLKS